MPLRPTNTDRTAMIVVSHHWLFYLSDSSAGSLSLLGDYGKKFNGECGGDEINMYEGNGDNGNTDATGAAAVQQVENCRDACKNKKAPSDSGRSWSSFTYEKGTTTRFML